MSRHHLCHVSKSSKKIAQLLTTSSPLHMQGRCASFFSDVASTPRVAYHTGKNFESRTGGRGFIRETRKAGFGDGASQSRSFFGDSVRSAGQKGQSAAVDALGSPGPFAAHLKDRAVIRLDGDDAFRFLQGLITNDISILQSRQASALSSQNLPMTSAPAMYTALLNPQGRQLYDLFLYCPPRPYEILSRGGEGPGDQAAMQGEEEGAPADLRHRDATLLADVDAAAVDDVLKLLKRYCLRMKVGLADVSQDLAVWARFGTGVEPHFAGAEPERAAEELGSIGRGGGHDAAGNQAAKATRAGWQWEADPRLPALGLRGLFPNGSQPPLVDADEEISLDHYRLWRYGYGVAEGTKEIIPGEALPLEFNLDGLHGVSFSKGCYVGQELTARTFHRGVIRKRVMPVKFVDLDGKDAERGPAPGTRVFEKESSKSVGKVVGALGPVGLAHLRLDAALKPGNALQTELEGGANGELKEILVQPLRPSWWPETWGKEEG